MLEDGKGTQHAATAHLELVKDVVSVGLDCHVTDPEHARDLLVGHPLAHPLDDFTLALR